MWPDSELLVYRSGLGYNNYKRASVFKIVIVYTVSECIIRKSASLFISLYVHLYAQLSLIFCQSISGSGVVK